MATTSNPLQLGQTLYELNDLSVICNPIPSDSTVNYNRFSYANGSSGGQQNEVWTDSIETLPIADVADIIDAKAVDIVGNCKQTLCILTNSGLTTINASGTNATGFTTTTSSWNFNVTGISYIVDSNPNTIVGTQLLMAGQTGSTYSLWVFNSDGVAGQLSSPIILSLPDPTAASQIVGACLCRCQTSARLIVFFVGNAGLLAADYGSSVLSSLALGQYPDTPIIAQTVVTIPEYTNGTPISFTTATLIPQSDTSQSNGNQQIAISFPYVPTGQSYGFGLSILDFDTSQENYPLTIVKTASYPVQCKPTTANSEVSYLIASGSVLNNGLQQIVVGFCGSYGTPLVAGCVSLRLFQYTSLGLTASNEFAGCNYDETGPIPFCSLGLNISAGLYGTATATSDSAALGIAVVGCGANIQNLAKNIAQISVSVVAVDPSTGNFTGQSSSTPTNLNKQEGLSVLTEVVATNPLYFAFPSDLTGNSVVLGAPTLTPVDGGSQVLAYIQAMPFESKVANGKSLVSFSESDSTINGYSISSDQTWTYTEAAGENLNLGPFTISVLMENTYSENFSNMVDVTETKEVSLTSSIYNEDMIIVYSRSYQVWTYPIYQTAGSSNPDGSIAVIFPTSVTDVQTVLPANDPDYGYIPSAQPGMLISYWQNSNDLTNYTAGSEIFKLTGLTVLPSGNNSTLTYSASDMTSSTQSATTTVFNSLSTNEEAEFNANLFDYLPTSFGLGITSGISYTNTNSTTTTSTYTSDFSLTFAPGNVKAEGYRYTIIPYVYFDNTYGCLMVSYTVDFSAGNEWSTYYSQPKVVLIATQPFSATVLQQCFSRSITFAADDQNNAVIQVAALNASFVSATEITFNVYTGQPDTSTGIATVPPDSILIGTYALSSMAPTQRLSIDISTGVSLQTLAYVTVEIVVPGNAAQVYWGVYPLPNFAT